MRFKAKKFFLSFILMAVIFVTVGTVFIAPKKAQAIPVEVTFSVSDVLSKIWSFIQDAVVTAGLRAGMNAAQYLAQRVAYSAATWVAAGAKGQAPLVQNKSFGEDMLDALGAAGGEFLGDLNKDWSKYFNICEPTMPNVKQALKIGVLSTMQPRAPKCDIRKIGENWTKFVAEFSNPRELLNKIQLSFEPTNNDVGAFLMLNDQQLLRTNTALNIASQNRGVKDADWSDLATTVSKRITTPRSLVKNEVTKSFNLKDNMMLNDFLATYLTGAVRPQNYGLALLATMSSTFFNTLGSELTKGLMSGMWKVGDLLYGPQYNPNQEGVAYGGREAAKASFSELIRPQTVVEADYNYVMDFTTCPTDERYRNVNNCTMDEGFGTAVNAFTSGQSLSIREAIDKGFLHRDWAIVPPSNTAKNSDQSCYKSAYCYSNLIKLRRMRIISLGFEMAASICANPLYGSVCSADNPPKLSQVVDNFYNCDKADELEILAATLTDPQSPNYQANLTKFNDLLNKNPQVIFCHLIDPNWVLKAPATQCLAKSSGPLLETSESSQRGEACADDASCIYEDEKGACKAFGYCTQEKNIWRFDGDSCQPKYESCRTYSNEASDNVSFLDATIDSGVCSANNAGCLWYSTFKTKDLSGQYLWSEKSTDRLYLNNKAVACEAQDNGCSTLVRVKRNLGANLIKNSNLEADKDKNSIPDNWPFSGSWLDGEGFDGDHALRLDEKDEISQLVQVRSGSVYLFSVYVKNNNTDDAKLTLRVKDTTTQAVLANKTFTISSNFDYTRQYVSFNSGKTELIEVSILSDSKIFYVDDMMLEEVISPEAIPSFYADYALNNLVYLKKAPDYLDCYKEWFSFSTQSSCQAANGVWEGNACHQPEVCNNFALWCSKTEVNCEKFTPLSGSDVPRYGIPSNTDYCPAECDGYAAFNQRKTNFEDTVFPVYLIPQTASVCTAQEQGCDEFTNLDALQTGQGEAKEYYSALRQCQKIDSNCLTFYTWEGQDIEGYQLKTFTLLKDANGTAPAIVGGQTDTCDYAKFKSQAYPDCREFQYVDANGKTHTSYRSYSKTVSCSDDCHPYRRTFCTNFGGQLVDNACVFYAVPSESTTCQASAAGCRAYKGNAGNNVRQVLNDDFESGTNSSWQGGVNSNVSTNIYGHSLLNANTGVVKKDLTGYVVSGKAYRLSFWAKPNKATGKTLNIQYNLYNGAVPPVFVTGLPGGQVSLGNDWQEYTLNPVIIYDEQSNLGKIELAFAGFNANELYLDNIKLEEIAENIYLVKNSWDIPYSCDNDNLTPYGALGILSPRRDQPQAQLNCGGYNDSQNLTHYLKSLAKQCREEAVGCESFIDTKNTTTPNTSVYNSYCDKIQNNYNPVTGYCYVSNQNIKCKVPVGQAGCYFDYEQVIPGSLKGNESELVIPADEYVYLVNDSAYACVQTSSGCQEVAKPVLDTQGKVKKDNQGAGMWTSLYILNNPQKYTDILCNSSELMCAEYTGTDGSKRYFKDPGSKICEYRSNININGVMVSGWFKTDSVENEPCYAEKDNKGQWASVIPKPGAPALDVAIYAVGGEDAPMNFYIANNKKEADGVTYKYYDGWVGKCPAEQNLCTKFVDPLGTSETGNKNYYYKNNDRLDKESCNGQASLKEGCVLFNDTGNSDLTWHAGYTYKLSTQKKDELVMPQSCPQVTCGVLSSGANQFAFPLNYGTFMPSGSPQVGVSDQCQEFDWEGVDAKIFNTDCTQVLQVADTLHKNNANVVLKVKRDRVCGQWLTCASNFYAEEGGKQVARCTSLKPCTQYDEAGQGLSSCSEFTSSARQKLTPAVYQQRASKPTLPSKQAAITWSSRDFSGYSLPEKFPLEYYISLTFSVDNSSIAKQDETKTTRLLYDTGTYCRQDSPDKGLSDCNGPILIPPLKRCVNSKCVLNIDGSEVALASGGVNISENELNKKAPEPSCRAYPERDSPFSYDILTGEEFLKTEFAGANFCAPGVYGCNDDLGCHYKKVTYGNGAKKYYYSRDAEDVAPEICLNSNTGITSCLGEYGKCAKSGNSCHQYLPCDPGDTCNITGTFKKACIDSGGKCVKDVVIADTVCVGGTADGQKCEGQIKVCSKSNKECIVDRDCDTTNGETCQLSYLSDICQNKGGVCMNKDEKYFEMVGWEGYCLERQPLYKNAAGINEVDYKAPCLTWMPVKHMAGLVNLYNQYKDAGFNKENVYYCAETKLVKDVQALPAMPAGFYDFGFVRGCNNNIGDPGYEQDWTECAKNIVCPEGYFVVLGNCNTWGNTTSPFSQNGWFTGAYDSCPYQCVPLGAVHAKGQPSAFPKKIPTEAWNGKDEFKTVVPDITITAGQSCWQNALELANSLSVLAALNGDLPQAKSKDSQGNVIVTSAKTLTYGRYPFGRDPNKKVMWYAQIQDAAVTTGTGQQFATIFDDCVLPNIPLASPEANAAPLTGVYKDYALAAGAYKLACTNLVQVSTSGSKMENKAWTDRVANVAAHDLTYEVKVGDLPAYKFETFKIGDNDHTPFGYGNPVKDNEKGYLNFVGTCLYADNTLLPARIVGADKIWKAECDNPSAKHGNLIWPIKDDEKNLPLNNLAYNAPIYEVPAPLQRCENDAQCNGDCDLTNSVTVYQKVCANDNDCTKLTQAGTNSRCSNGVCVEPMMKLDNNQYFYYCLNNSGCLAGHDCVNNMCTAFSAIDLKGGSVKSVSLGSCKKAPSKACKSNDECKYLSRCVDKTCFTSGAGWDNTGEVKIIKTNTNENSSDAANRLQTLYAKTYDSLAWTLMNPLGTQNPGEYPYKFLSSTKVSWDVSANINLLNNTPRIPQIAAPSANANTGYEALNQVQINGRILKPGEVWEMEEGTAVSLSFYAWADTNQMPLRQVAINWGLGIQDVEDFGEGKYKNKRYTCNVNADDDQGIAAKGFGGSSVACEPEPFVFERYYVNRDSSGSFKCVGLTDTAPKSRVPLNSTYGKITRRYCEYNLKIFLKDNWGWCTGTDAAGNGTCAGGVDGTPYCYNGEGQSQGSGDNECNYRKGYNAWFTGPQIIIYEKANK